MVIRIAFVILILPLFVCMAIVASYHASASHNTRLPLIPDTPAIFELWKTGGLTYCLDSRASNYPNFRAQVIQVNQAYFDVLGIHMGEVSYGSDCEIQHRMPDSFVCNGCAANIKYADWPVIIQYKWQLGYVYWQGTTGHESGHITGLHEQYQDFGSIQCTKRTDTVMDCGSHIILPPLGIWFPQGFDVNNLREWLYPPPVQSAGIAYHAGKPFVWYCGGDPHLARADHTVIMYWDVSTSGAFYWSGIETPIARLPDVGGDGCIREYVYCYPGRELYVNQQIRGWPEASQRWYLRNDTYAGTC